MTIRAVVFDLGGVVLGAPLTTIRAFEAQQGLPTGSVGQVIKQGGSDGPWAQLERGQIGLPAFYSMLDATAQQLERPFSSEALMSALAAEATPNLEVLETIQTLRVQGIRVAALTNNWDAPNGFQEQIALIAHHFDDLLESWRLGCRKPEPAIYERLLHTLQLPAHEIVFLDDLGSNLKPARSLGLHTLHVTVPAQAMIDLKALLARENALPPNA